MNNRLALGLLISFLNFLVIFGIPSQYLEYDVNLEFVICVTAAMSVMIWAQIGSRYHLFFYQAIWVYFIFFGYLIQTGLGVSYISGSVTKISSTFVNIYLVHLATLVCASIYLPQTFMASEIRGEKLGHSRVFLTICVAICIPAIIGSIVGWDLLLSSRQEFHANKSISSTSFFLVLIAKTIPFVLLALLAENARETLGVFPKLIFIAVLVTSMSFSNPGNTARFLSLSSLVLIVIFAVPSYKRKKLLGQIALAFPALGLIVLPVTSMLRNGFFSLEQALTVDFFGSLEFSALQAMLDGIDMVDQLNGAQLLSGLFILVPRSILPWKSDGLGPEIASTSGYVFSNVAVPPIFASYVDGGLIGVLVFTVLIAWVFEKYEIDHGRRFQWRSRNSFYSAIIFSTLPMLARGDFTTYMLSLYAFAISYEALRPFGRMVIFSVRSTQR